MTLAVVPFETYETSVAEALDALGAGAVLKKQERILLKPNLVNDTPFPVTTAPAFAEAVVRYVKSACKAEIVIAEGCGEPSMTTHEVFERLGYDKLAKRHGVKLIDLNTEPLLKKSIKGLFVFPEMHLPKIAFTHYIISLPVLKAHSLSVMTGTLKNMLGFAPPKYYAGKHGIWNKAVFHNRIQDSISDLNAYLKPDLTVMDASVGLIDFHLGGPKCNPPVKKIMAGYDPYEIDREAARLLKIDPNSVGHLNAEKYKRQPE